MNITRKQTDALNAVVTVAIEKSDYADKVEKVLNNYRKTANIPGFRKGHVPAGMIKKQYGSAVKFDEINKLLQDSLGKYLADEKVEYLGNPLPVEKNAFDENADDYTFDFELGLVPEINIDLKPKKGLVRYEITVDDAQVDAQIERIGKQFGKLIAKGEVLDQDDLEITGSFFNEEKNIDAQATFTLNELSKKSRKSFIGKKIGDQWQLKTKDLFSDAHSLMHYLKVSHDEAHHLDVEVTFTLEEINVREAAEFNQELFDKLFPAGEVTSEEQLREKIRENITVQYGSQADQHFLNEVTDYLVDNTKFDLPVAFLKKWLRTAGEKELSEEEADKEFESSEKGLRYQLIEGKILSDNNLNPTYDELMAYAHTNIKNQLLQYGMPTDDEQYVEGIVKRVLQNREEVQRLNQQLVFQKLLDFYKENAHINLKKVTFDEFVKAAFPHEEA
ncbi:trigger factor [Capnocytophaga haemolytica]|uniref:Trigger factor n=1 Tax=Capnocytophaga haemolytica TaxID=45243 RepID=A0AAX2GWN8_9FLAO|nr:trigger factor [Capnocytophaga haemolytica]AMD84805.1 peptidylprolyl isomerase [Capnocytophaga haemolytica]SFN74824.1 trigger factor [Capnocytophaga haemolytica]SNV07237.1 Trigger factor [Capnocytophaga haemolytica]